MYSSWILIFVLTSTNTQKEIAELNLNCGQSQKFDVPLNLAAMSIVWEIHDQSNKPFGLFTYDRREETYTVERNFYTIFMQEYHKEHLILYWLTNALNGHRISVTFFDVDTNIVATKLFEKLRITGKCEFQKLASAVAIPDKDDGLKGIQMQSDIDKFEFQCSINVQTQFFEISLINKQNKQMEINYDTVEKANKDNKIIISFDGIKKNIQAIELKSSEYQFVYAVQVHLKYIYRSYRYIIPEDFTLVTQRNFPMFAFIIHTAQLIRLYGLHPEKQTILFSYIPEFGTILTDRSIVQLFDAKSLEYRAFFKPEAELIMFKLHMLLELDGAIVYQKSDMYTLTNRAGSTNIELYSDLDSATASIDSAIAPEPPQNKPKVINEKDKMETRGQSHKTNSAVFVEKGKLAINNEINLNKLHTSINVPKKKHSKIHSIYLFARHHLLSISFGFFMMMLSIVVIIAAINWKKHKNHTYTILSS